MQLNNLKWISEENTTSESFEIIGVYVCIPDERIHSSVKNNNYIAPLEVPFGDMPLNIPLKFTLTTQ